jgi:predicted phage terminase large subunit-like protein
VVAQRVEPYAEYTDLDGVRAFRSEQRLRHFVKNAWHVVEPATPYLHNWHIDALSDHLEATLTGEIRNLLVTMPPRAMKSLTISVFFPAWAWLHHPELRFLYASYAQALATQHSMATRRVIESDWYQGWWGDRFELADDDNLKTRFSNDHRGERISTSVGAAVTGMGGNLVICDDPHNVQQAESDAVRQSTLTWWDQAMSTRLNNPKTGARIIVMQRVHEDDLAGHVANDPAWTHLNLPMEYEPTTYVSPIGWSDPRTQDGELLWPERMDRAFTEGQKRTLGSYAYAGQYQQRPAPAEGGILKAHWFGRYAEPSSHYYAIIQAWDTAFKTTDGADYSACVTLGIGAFGFDVLDVFHAKLEFPDLERAVQTQHMVWSSRYPTASFSVLVEDKASGQSLIQSARRWAGTNMNIIPVPVPSGMDKERRVHEISPVVEARRVRLPVPTPERPVPWLEPALHEWTTFPLVKHDDITDAFAIAVRRAAGIGDALSPATDQSAFAPVAETRRDRATRHRRMSR